MIVAAERVQEMVAFYDEVSGTDLEASGSA
jgi:hypothetical protein